MTMRLPLTASLLLGLATLPMAATAGNGDLTVALGGDMIGPYRLLDGPSDPAFDAVTALFRTADLGFANQEGAIFDMEGFDGFPAAENGGGTPRSPAATAGMLAANGITLVSKGNNHATDWGTQGLMATLRVLENAGITVAGVGPGPEAACAPAYRTQANGETVALVSAAATFPPMSLAMPAVNRRGVLSRPGPGICALHVQPVRAVTAVQLEALRSIAGPIGMRAGPDGHQLRIGDQRFRIAPQPSLAWEMKPEDIAAILSSIGTAHPKAALTIFAVHAHETAGMDDDMPPGDFEPLVLHRANEAPSASDPTPADYVPRLMHQAIDAGADIAVRTGPHVLNGIEIYRGKPIFYGLGSLIFDFGGRRSYTAPGGQTIALPDGWYDTVIPRVTMHGGRITEIRLHPAIIDPTAGPGGGLPHLAAGADAARILSHLQDMSRAYGTTIRIDGDTGIIQP